MNGELTLGENIADLGGVLISFNALKKAIAGKNLPKIDGFTPEQRFFISWAQAWRRLYRPATLKQRLISDPHSPSMYRTNGPLSNLEVFFEAFDCKEGDGMVRSGETRVKIW